MPTPTPRPQVSTPASSSPTVEDDIVEEYLEIGSLYARKGRYDKAEELFQKVTKENPSSSEAHNNLGFVYLKQEKYELAEKEFKEALRIDPSSVLPYYNMACLYSRKGMEVEALIYLKRALKRDARVKLWAITDEDFDGLRTDVVFQELLGISSGDVGEKATR
jgi:tetratricopeptide (TPR) repeat protein